MTITGRVPECIDYARSGGHAGRSTTSPDLPRTLDGGVVATDGNGNGTGMDGEQDLKYLALVDELARMRVEMGQANAERARMREQIVAMGERAVRVDAERAAMFQPAMQAFEDLRYLRQGMAALEAGLHALTTGIRTPEGLRPLQLVGDGEEDVAQPGVDLRVAGDGVAPGRPGGRRG